MLVDTLRRDHLGVYGFAGGISPNIDWLAKESVLFDNAFSQAPWTKPSIATLFTSVHPDVHGLDNHGGLFGERNNELLTTGVLSSETVTMAEVFQSEGYRTAAFVANPWLDAPFGFDQGFGRYEILRDGNIILQEARDWLETTDGEPFFLYLHFMDVHSPYDAPEGDFEEMRESSSLEVTQSPPRDVLERLPPYLDGISWFGPEDLAASGWGGIIDHRLGRSRTLRARYAANVRAFDRLIGPFLQQIRNSELGRTAYVVLTSDHGEELLEHGGWDHGFNLYDHQIRVPLLIRAPGARFAGRRVRRGIGLIDLLPTLTALAGLEAPKDVQGRALAQLLERDDLSDFASFATATKHRQGVYSVRTGRFKLLVDVASRTVSLFDLASDPLEYTDIAEERPEVAEELGRFLTSYLEENAGIPALAPELAPIRDELKQKLEALGYLSR